MVKDKLILGIDHASRTGWSIVLNGKAIKTGDININASEYRCFEQYYVLITKLMLEVKPDRVVLEKPMSLRNAKIARYLIGLFSIVKLVALQHNIKIIEREPSDIKKTITGKGNADKNCVMYTLIEKHGIDSDLIYKPVYYKNKEGIKEFLYDESDATALALTEYLKGEC